MTLFGFGLFGRQWLVQKSIPSVAKSNRTETELRDPQSLQIRGPPVERTLNSFNSKCELDTPNSTAMSNCLVSREIGLVHLFIIILRLHIPPLAGNPEAPMARTPPSSAAWSRCVCPIDAGVKSVSVARAGQSSLLGGRRGYGSFENPMVKNVCFRTQIKRT